MKIKGLNKTALLGACIGGLMLSGCGGDKTSTDANADTSKASKTASKKANPAMWLVEDEDTKVYLFGTVHVLKPDLDWQTDQFKSILSSADAIYLEADVSAASTADLQGQILELSSYQDGRNLKDALNDAQEKEVNEAAEQFGLTLDILNPMKPWAASMTLAQMQMVQSGYYAASGAEMKILEAAKAQDKEMRYFEGVVEQISFFADMPEEMQVNFLVASAEQMEEVPDMLDQMVSDWSAGNVEGIAGVMADPENFGDPEIHSILLTDRNARWVKTLNTLMKDEAGTFMVAVGAGHLAGEDSVIDMLEKQGETVTRQ